MRRAAVVRLATFTILYDLPLYDLPLYELPLYEFTLNHIYVIVRMAHFSEHEGLLVVDGVEAVGGDDLGAVLSPDRVGRQAVHVHLDVGADLAVRQELAGDDLGRTL
jgi:hypothetical protein